MRYRLLQVTFAGQLFDSLNEAMAYADKLYGEYIVIEDQIVARSKVKKIWVKEEKGKEN
jgi:hypothetical protein